MGPSFLPDRTRRIQPGSYDSGMPSRSRRPSTAPSPTAPPQAPNPPGAHEATGAEAPTRVLRRFRIVFNAVKTHFQQVEKSAGLGGAQLWALSVIAAQPDMGVNDLARAMDIHQTTASNLVKALLGLSLITSHRNGPDRRAVHLQVLPAGERLLRKAPGPFGGVLPEALARLDPQLLERLDQDLGALITALGADERAAGIPLAQM